MKHILIFTWLFLIQLFNSIVLFLNKLLFISIPIFSIVLWNYFYIHDVETTIFYLLCFSMISTLLFLIGLLFVILFQWEIKSFFKLIKIKWKESKKLCFKGIT